MQVGPVGCIKIQAEGAELDVLRGLRRTVEREAPYIVCEVLPVHDPATPSGALRLSRQRQLQSLIAALGYRVYRASAGSLHPIDDIGIHDDVALSNHVFAPTDAELEDSRGYETAVVQAQPSPL
jgi:hypothetical protein